MTLGPRWVWVVILGGAVAALVVGSILGTCNRDRDVPGQRADSVIASDLTVQRRFAEQDSTIAYLEDSLRVTDRERAHWKRTYLASLRHNDSVQAQEDSAVAAGVPDSVAPAVFWKDRWTEQRRIAARLRSETVPALFATIAADSLGIRQRDAYGAEMKSQRDFARARAREVTREFAEYREATKPGIDLGLFRVPEWTAYVAVGVGSAALTYAVVK